MYLVSQYQHLDVCVDTVKKKMQSMHIRKKKVKNEKVEISGLIFMLTSSHKITSPTL